MHKFDSVAIVGVGLIGGSIGRALRERGIAQRIVGIGRRRASLELALARGCVTEIASSIADGVREARLVVVCTPVDSIAAHIVETADYCPRESLITDVGSTKAELVSKVDAALAGKFSRVPFVGSHPLAGSEKSGPATADARLFEDRVVVVTPTSVTDPSAADSIEAFWRRLGARVVRMSPHDHDATLARTSHLPHLVAAALAAATPDDVLPLTAGGWQDTTRVAAGDVELWRQIFFANRAPTLKALADFETVLSRFRAALETGDGALLAKMLAEGKRRRDAVGS